MKLIGIIDIGSNSMRLVIVKITDGYFKVIDEVKESVRLGKGMGENGLIEPMRANRAVEALKFYKSLCSSFGVEEIIAVATEAVRRASNGHDFIERILSETGISIRVLSGEEEAYYDYFGVINSMEISDSLIMDIGGGSAEIIWVKDRMLINSVSLPFGAINITERFGLSNILDRPTEEELKDFLFDAYSKIPWLADIRNYPLVGIGGTIRNIGKIDRKSRAYPLDVAHNYPMTDKDVIGIYDVIKIKDVKQREKVKGLSKERADIFLGALSAVAALIEYCSIPKLTVSGSGLREGLIFEYILNGGTPVEDVVDFSVNRLLNQYGVNKSHSNRVWKTAEALYSHLKSVHNIQADCRNIIKVSCLLHDIGINISYYDHHKHSFYMILHSRINGLSHKELIMVSYIAAFHRKDEFKMDEIGLRKLLGEEDMAAAQKIGILLKISEALNKGNGENIEQVQCSIQGDMVIIKLLSKNNPSHEIKEAMEAAGTFKRIFNKRLIIV